MSQGRASVEKHPLGRALARLVSIGRTACELSVVILVLLVALEVVCRSLLNVSLQITYEISGYLLVAIAFIGMAVSLQDRALFRVEFIYGRLGQPARTVVQVGFDLIALGFGGILAYQLIRLVISSYTRGVIEATILGTPLYIPQLVMPLGVVLMDLVLIAHLAEGVVELSTRPTANGEREKAQS